MKSVLILGVVLLITLGAFGGAASYLIRRGADYRAPRLLPGGYTVARYTHEGARGWGLSSPSDPFGHVNLVQADGTENAEGWELMRAAVEGPRVIIIGEYELGRTVVRTVACELDTTTGRVTWLGGVADAERRIADLRLGGKDAKWVDFERLPRAPRSH